MAGVKLEQLQLATLSVVNPKIEAMFQKHVRAIVEDVMNRPGEPAARKLILEFVVKPVVERDESGEWRCDEVRVTLQGKSKIPTYQTRAFPMKVSKAGLLFNREIPEDLHQPSLIE